MILLFDSILGYSSIVLLAPTLLSRLVLQKKVMDKKVDDSHYLLCSTMLMKHRPFLHPITCMSSR